MSEADPDEREATLEDIKDMRERLMFPYGQWAFDRILRAIVKRAGTERPRVSQIREAWEAARDGGRFDV